MADTLYTAVATATGDGRAGGRAVSDDGQLDVTLAVPRAMGGPGGGTNPEQLFAAGWSSCFHSALKMVAAQRKVPVTDSAVVAEVDLVPNGDGGFSLGATLHVELGAASPRTSPRSSRRPRTPSARTRSRPGATSPSRSARPSRSAPAAPRRGRLADRSRAPAPRVGPAVQSRQNSLPSTSCMTMQDSFSSSATSTRTHVAPSATSRSRSASKRGEALRPHQPGADAHVEVHAVLDELALGDALEVQARPDPVGSLHADQASRSTAGSAASASSQVANPSGATRGRSPAPRTRTGRRAVAARSRT